MIPSPEDIRIISPIAFFVLLAIGIRKIVFLPLAYFILVYCKLSSYYPILETIRAELLFAIIILLRLLFAKNIKHLNLTDNKVHKYLTIFCGCVALSFLFSWNMQFSWNEAVYHFIKVLLLYVMVLLAVDNDREVMTVVMGIVLVYTYLAYEPVWGLINGIGGLEYKYGTNYIADIGPLSGHVAAANNMNQMIPIAYFLVHGVGKNKIKAIIFSIPLVVFVICLIGTGSRGGVLGFLMIGLCIVYYSKKRMRNIALLGAFSIFLFFMTGFSKTAERIDADSTWGRFIGLTHGIEMVKRGNVIGVGPGCYMIARAKYFHYRMMAHNVYGQVIGELGIPGTIAWFFFIRQIFLNFIESKKRLKAVNDEKSKLYYIIMGLQISVIVRLFIGLASHSLYFYYWYVVAALSYIILKNTKKYEAEEKCR